MYKTKERKKERKKEHCIKLDKMNEKEWKERKRMRRQKKVTCIDAVIVTLIETSLFSDENLMWWKSFN